MDDPIYAEARARAALCLLAYCDCPCDVHGYQLVQSTQGLLEARDERRLPVRIAEYLVEPQSLRV